MEYLLMIISWLKKIFRGTEKISSTTINNNSITNNIYPVTPKYKKQKTNKNTEKKRKK